MNSLNFGVPLTFLYSYSQEGHGLSSLQTSFASPHKTFVLPHNTFKTFRNMFCFLLQYV